MMNVLIAAELRELLEAPAIPDGTIHWLPKHAPLPAGDFAAVIPLLSRRIDGPTLERLPRLRIVANCAAGTDNIDLAAARRRGVIVTNTPGVLTEATADLTWALVLAVARRLKEGLELLSRGRWEGWHPMLLLGLELKGATLGIVGAGRIGEAVARRAVGFGMRILYTSRRRKPELEQDLGAAFVPLETLLAESDVVTLHVPATAATRGLIGRRELGTMRPGAILINTARGDVVDEAALLEALASGRLAGAGLDVYAAEPRVHPDLVAHPRVVTLPHVGSATHVTRRAMARLALENVRAVLAGRAPLTPVGD